MKIISKKNKFNLLVNDLWFLDKNDFTFTGDIINCYGVDEDMLPYLCKSSYGKIFTKKQRTLFLDLEQPEDILFDNIQKTVRYEIKRCEKEMFDFKVLDENSISDSILEDFEKVYNDMYKDKGINCSLSIPLVNDYIKNNNFILTYTLKENDIYAYHAYTHDECGVRLLYSCSNFRGLQDLKAEIGRANKYLHWQDIMYFKKMGIKIYDFGGVKSFENPNGIDKFKMNFGGIQKVYYNVVLSNSFKGMLFLFLKNLFKR